MKKSKPKSYGMYRSGLEQNFAKAVPRKMFEYEPCAMPYVMHRKYTPDFVYKHYLIECKGYFRVGDTMKYKSIRESMTDNELIFVLSDPNKKLRKGAKMTMGQWCDKEGFKHYTLHNIESMLQYIKE